MNYSNYFVEEFESVGKYLHELSTRKNCSAFERYGGGPSSEEGSESFTNSRSLEHANELAKKGWKEGWNKAKKILKETSLKSDKANIQKHRPYKHVVGYSPHVPNAIKGIPNSMIATKPVYKKVRVVKIYVSIGYNSSIGANQAQKALIKAIRYAIDLEKAGIRTEINTVAMSEYDNSLFGQVIKLKDFRSSVNLLKIAYFMGHPSALRRHKFKWLETLPEDKMTFTVERGMYSGYGRSVYDEDTIEKYLNKDSKKVIFTYMNLKEKSMKEVHELASKQLS